ncbi:MULTISPECIES: ATP-binding cassette domain-containing protein [Subtercola]|uniref:ABC transporter ATP-binding protein n=1 Tax=Subtercola vilae TaxID=2056433 RepID=A0A4T2C8F0_9MICO|nr:MULTISPECIES: ABC transporter ATP-binding protein [Subtercola]MEA9984961.1 ABC transporter ATP-binding protein [Subtercola sp. RTI3]TIH39912.1 ABC transporter ATP-binding protein [Subtercola vilae]
MSEPVLVASDVTIEYPAHSVSAAYTAVRGVSLRIEPGEIIGLVGSSGSGKSTFAQVAAGQAGRGSRESVPRIVGGGLRTLGFDLRKGVRGRTFNKLTFGVGYLPQDSSSDLTSNMTIAESIAEPLFSRDKRYNEKDASLRVATLLDALLLPVGTARKLPHELSSGQRQRVAIARSLILDPVFYVADEPTAGVDVSVRGPVIDVISQLQRDRGATTLIVSHDLEVLRRSVDRIVVLHEGVVVGLGTIDDVLNDPRHPYVAGLAKAIGGRGQ